jgi:hypothetical protein
MAERLRDVLRAERLSIKVFAGQNAPCRYWSRHWNL